MQAGEAGQEKFMNKKRIVINMTAQLLAFAVNMLLGFVLVPVIDAMIPNAYGFTDIANKFVSKKLPPV